MRIETIATGDELLTGLTSDTNSRFFQEALLHRTGLTVRRGTVVGDDRNDIIEALNHAAARCDVVLVSGGLGPTADDLTAECAAMAAGVPLVENAQALRHLEDRFRERGFRLSPNNLRQALVPQGAEVIINPEGSAPMFIQMRGNCIFFYVPGVPREYRHLVGAHVVPRIAERHGSDAVRKLAVLKTIGLPESHLDERVQPLVAKYPQVTFGFRTHPPENHLKLLAVSSTEEKANALLESAVAEAMAVLEEKYFGRDEQTLAGVVLAKLRDRGERLAVAESCTGGLLAQLLTAEPGASDVLYGGACTYQDAAKTQWADVPPELLSQFGAVSAEVARAMASGIRNSTKSHWALSTTGFAGPGGGDTENPVGTVYFALAGPKNEVLCKKHRFFGSREDVRNFAAFAALDLLRRTLGEMTS